MKPLLLPRLRKPNPLCIYPRKIGEFAVVAAPRQPDDSLADDAGFIKDEFIWAALDCPRGFAIVGDENRIKVLGRMTADIRELYFVV